MIYSDHAKSNFSVSRKMTLVSLLGLWGEAVKLIHRRWLQRVVIGKIKEKVIFIVYFFKSKFRSDWTSLSCFDYLI
jgi:hypothetical protein